MQPRTAGLPSLINHREIGSMDFHFSDFPKGFPVTMDVLPYFIVSSQTLNCQLYIKFLENNPSILSQAGTSTFLKTSLHLKRNNACLQKINTSLHVLNFRESPLNKNYQKISRTEVVAE